MRPDLAPDEDLLRRLPLPLAQLCRRVHNAWTPLERHLAAFYLWEASLKLLGSVAVVTYAGLGEAEPELAECLQSLARPALGHWWGIVRRLLPVLAARQPGAFLPLRDFLLGKHRDDLPRAAGLDAALREHLEGKAGARSGVYLAELLDRLVRYRNKEIGHGAAGARPAEFYERLGRSLLLGAVEALGRLDVLAGRQLLYIAEVRQAPAGWLAQRYELAGETARRALALELPRAATTRLPEAGQVYLDGGGLVGLHPLVVYDLEANEAAFLNARPGRGKTEYLCYTSGRSVVRPDLGTAQRGLLATVLGMAVSEAQVSQWAARSQAEEPPGPEAPPGRWTLGEYELISELGRGGMGVVYRAWQPSLGRQVALKKLLQSGDARTEARFQREIRALGRVEHPHLVKVFASGSDGDQWFYAMELVEGAPLSAVCERLQGSTASVPEVDLKTWQQAVSTACEEARKAEKPLGGARPQDPEPAPAPAESAAEREPVAAGRGYVGQVAELVRQVAEAAHALHERGILHRDIKPGNVLVTAGGGQAVLMDLGLAQIADDEEGRLTRTRQFVGTLRYASPEQLLGAKLDRRADVYSLGATLWELLALRPLFGVSEQTPTPDLILKIQQAEPERLRKANSAVPRDLEAITHKCLEEKPAKRYPSARQLAEDLGRFLADEPVLARPVRGSERAWKWMKRRPAVAALLVVSGLATLALVGVTVGLVYNGQLQQVVGKLRQVNGQLTEAKQGLEDKNKALARAQAEARRYAYVADMNLAHAAWQEGDTSGLAERLASHGPGREKPDLRGFEWYYLKHLDREAANQLGGRDLAGANGPVYAVAVSPDGRRIAWGGSDGFVRVWDRKERRQVRFVGGRRRNFILSVAFSPNGKTLASAGADGTVQLWDLAGAGRYVLPGPIGAKVTALAMSRDGTQLAFGDGDGTVVVWDLDPATGRPKDGSPIRRLALPPSSAEWGPIWGLAFNPLGDRLAAAVGIHPGFGEVALWDLKAGPDASPRPVGRQKELVHGVAFAPDGKTLASAGFDHTVRIWDVETGDELRALRGHRLEVLSAAFSPDGKRLASASWDRTVKVWDTRTGQELLTLRGHTAEVYGVAWIPDQRAKARLVSAGEDGSVKVWDTAHDPTGMAMERLAPPVSALTWGSDRRLLSVGAGPILRAWGPETQQTRKLAAALGRADYAALSQDGRRLALAGGHPRILLWQVAGDHVTPLPEVGADAESIDCLALSRDGKRLAAAWQDGAIKVWEVAGGREVRSAAGLSVPRAPPESGGKGRDKDWDPGSGKGQFGPRTDSPRARQTWIRCLAFDAKAKYLAAGDAAGGVTVWDVTTGGRVFPAGLAAARPGTDAGKATARRPVYGVAFSPDGRLLATAGADDAIALWDLGGKRMQILRGHLCYVYAVAFSPDGKRLASASEDWTVKVWDVETGLATLTLAGHGARVKAVAFSPAGDYLASADEHGVIRIWPGPRDAGRRPEDKAPSPAGGPAPSLR